VTCPPILSDRGVHLALASLAGLLVVAMLSEIGENTRLLTLLLEALEGPLEILVFVDYDFRQTLTPPFLAFARRLGID
jgi:hypothetical protein